MEGRMNETPQRTGLWKTCKDKLMEYILLVICTSIIVICLILLVFAFKYKWLACSSVWGQYGDFVGGVLGTVVSVLSVFYLIATLREQQKANIEVSQNYRDVAEVYLAQQFDNNYQHLMKLYDNAVSSYKNQNDNGRKALKGLYSSLYNKELDTTKCYADRKDGALLIFDKEFYIPNRISSAVHFRILYQIFSLIENCGLDEQKYKVKYAKLVRSQLDEDELLLLRYNCWCRYGEHMRQYVNQYNLLKHLPYLSLQEFRYWRQNVITDEIMQNAMDTELIEQKKQLTRFISETPSSILSTEILISDKYETSLNRSEDNRILIYSLVRHDDKEDFLSVDFAYSSLGDVHICNFIIDYLHEMLEFSNFCIYNSHIDYESIKRVNQDRKITEFRVTVTSPDPIIMKYKQYLSTGPELEPTPIDS